MKVKQAMLKRIFILSLIILFIPSCSQPGTEYFPLGNKNWWQYSIKRKIKGELKTQKLRIADMNPVKNESVQIIYPRKRMDERIEVYEKTSAGIIRVDLENDTRAQILPGELKKDITWQENTKILFLESKGAFSATFEKKIKQHTKSDTCNCLAGLIHRCINN